MTRPSWFAFASTLLLAGCVTGNIEPVTLDYAPPQVDPTAKRSQEWPGRADRMLPSLAVGLTSAGFEDVDTATTGDAVIARYSGELEPFVDCGTLRLPGEATSRPAAAAELDIGAFANQPSWTAIRQMRLDARMMTRTRPSEVGFMTRSEVTYVVTRTIDTMNASGAVLGTDRALISFESGGVGRFANGTVCQPTGVLESRLSTLVADASNGTERSSPALAGNRPPSAPSPAAEIDMAALLTEAPPVSDGIATSDLGPPPAPQDAGSVLTTADLTPPEASIEPAAPSGGARCPNADSMAPGGCSFSTFARETGADATPGFEVKVAGGADGLRTGSPLTLEVTLPGADRYFHVAYLASDGLVYHFGPKFIEREGIGERFLYETGLELPPGTKTELVMAMASQRELFAFARPPSEPALDTLAVLSERFDPADRDIATVLIERPAGS